jgi:nitric oxide reductase large subunit
MKAVAADNRLEKKFVEVAVSKKALVTYRFVVDAFVLVLLPETKPENIPLVALKLSVKKLVVVLLVVEAFTMTRFVAVAFVALRRVIVPDAAVKSVTARVEIVVVARLDVPVTTKVLVVVALIVVKLSMKATAADNRLEKKLVEVPLSKKALAE